MSDRFKLLILDYGGVYSFGDTTKNSNFNTIISGAFGREPSDIERQKINQSAHLLGANKISVEEHIVDIGEILSVSQLPTVQQFEDATIAVTNPPSPEMIELVRTVRESGIKVSLLSDMYMFEVERTRPWGRYEGFDYVSLSAEAGMTKHDPGFFEHTLAHFGIAAQDALFVDDSMKNIETADIVGLVTLLADKKKYTYATQLADEIRQCLATAK